MSTLRAIGLVLGVALFVGLTWVYSSQNIDCAKHHGVLVRTAIWYGCVQAAKD